jgi:GNAT superfamily N-acetyltransferase
MAKEEASVLIHYLADRPEYAPVCAAWAFGQWGCQTEGKTIETSVQGFSKCAQKNALPLALIALEGKKPAGHIVLCEADCDERPDLTPWMASVFVHPFHRGKGLSLQLIRRAENEAKRLGIQTLYLVTENAKGLYEKCGWKEFDKVQSKFGGISSLMKKSL